MDNLILRSFSNSIVKLSEDGKFNNISDIAEAFYQAGKRLEKEKSKSRRNKLLIGAGGVGLSGAGLYGAHKAGIGKKIIGDAKNKVKNSIYSNAEKFGREAGKATNIAADAYTKTLKSGAHNVVKKFRGGEFVSKLIKKVLFK